MATFLETPRFPDTLAALAEGGACYSTSVVMLLSGYEQRNINWTQSRGRWDISNGLQKRENVEQALAFFRSVKGKAYGFRFKDFQDFSVTTMTDGLFITVSSLVFQMVKIYVPTGGSISDTRYIQKPIATGFQMYRLGVLLSSGTGANQYTLDTTTGLVTMGAGSDTDSTHYTWKGEFDVPCRFDTDQMIGRTEQQGGFYEWNPIPIVEIRV